MSRAGGRCQQNRRQASAIHKERSECACRRDENSSGQEETPKDTEMSDHAPKRDAKSRGQKETWIFALGYLTGFSEARARLASLLQK